MNRVLFFDTETTGLIPKKKGRYVESVSNDSPHIVQLSYAIYDLNKREIVEKYDTYVKIDEHVEMSEGAFSVTGITKEICVERGVSIIEAIRKFHDAYITCNIVAAHNMEFDKKMINIEIERNRHIFTDVAPQCFTVFNNIYEKQHIIENYCTMENGTELCGIDMPYQKFMKYKNGKSVIKYKFPKLTELYTKLFTGDPLPHNLHNSMVDVLIGLRCYLKMQQKINTCSFI